MEICFVEWLQEQKGKGFQVFGRFKYADIDPDKLVLVLFTSDGGGRPNLGALRSPGWASQVIREQAGSPLMGPRPVV